MESFHFFMWAFTFFILSISGHPSTKYKSQDKPQAHYSIMPTGITEEYIHSVTTLFLHM